jgi:glycosyltransferase involved in cell wall biosynthesis
MSAPLRILLTADPMLPVPPTLYGGIERVIDDMLGALRARGHSVALLAHRDSTAAADARFSWPNIAGGFRDHVANAQCFSHAVRTFEPQLVHSFSRLAYFGTHLFGRLPLLMSYQRLPTARTVRWAARLGSRSLQFTGCSEYIAALGRRAGGTWQAIPNCVDARRYTPVTAVPADAPLVFLSRLDRIKGAHTAIAIARRSKRRLTIAGNRAESGAEAEYFEREIAPHLDGDSVRYIGPVDDAAKNALLGQAAAMLLPIEWDEPFGIVMIEAMACGTPVIAFDRGAVREVVRDGIDGFVVPDADAAVAAVARLPSVARTDCRARIEATFDVPRVTDRYEALYRQRIAAR